MDRFCEADRTRFLFGDDPDGNAQTLLPSLGATITSARLDLLAKQRGTRAGFAFVPVAQRTRVELVLSQAA